MISTIDAGHAKSKRFLVSTSKSVLVVEPSSKRIEHVHVNSGLYYGVDISDRDIRVAARNRMVSSSDPSDLERGEILVFTRDLRFVESIRPDFPMRDLHQIRRIGNRLFATCSFDNMIAIYQDGNWTQWLPLDRPANPPMDRNHFNSIECIDGKLCLLAHNQTLPSEILVCNSADLQIEQRIALGLQAHNVWKQGDEWCVCDSANGRLLGNSGFEVVTGGFPRGISIGDEFALVGISEIAERRERDFTHAEIAVYDKTWHKVDSIHLQNEGLILDIAALS